RLSNAIYHQTFCVYDAAGRIGYVFSLIGQHDQLLLFVPEENGTTAPKYCDRLRSVTAAATHQ
ncbi:hypothetical protein, partial [Acinetobacter baumannii]|uniref:hypothetical protein n=1 Tax=Acinetobacter baumannii TaxID=470 RepID=UPI001BC86CE7